MKGHFLDTLDLKLIGIQMLAKHGFLESVFFEKIKKGSFKLPILHFSDC